MEQVTKNDFLRQLTFQLAKPYVSNRKLRGETKLLAEKLGFVDAASNTMNHTFQGIRRGRCYRFAKHTLLACMICSQRVCPQHRKIPKTHIAWNVEQFVVALVCMFVWFCVWNTSSVCWKFSCTSAKSFTSWNYAVGRKQILDFRFKIVMLFQTQSNHMPIINGLRSTINRLQPWASGGETEGPWPSLYFENFSKKRLLSQFWVGKKQFHHFCLPPGKNPSDAHDCRVRVINGAYRS